jgi:pyruvate/2-oxoglutarate dehydrogenase complex dihydrolipoamide acyltransferase (E2) component
MSIAILLPELGTGEEIVRVSAWLIDPGDCVVAGDRIVEVLIRGVSFDVSAPASGVLAGIEKPLDAVVAAGDTLGRIEPGELFAEDTT